MKKYKKGFIVTMIILLVIIIIFAIISVLYLLGNNSMQKNQGVNEQIAINSQISITLPQYIGGQKSSWPPVIQESGEPYSCTPGASGMGVRKEITERTINGKTYCITYIGEGAVGITYKTYTFTTFGTQGSSKTTTFTLEYVSCDNYRNNSVDGGIEYNQCKIKYEFIGDECDWIQIN